MSHNVNRYFRIGLGLLLMLAGGTSFAQQPPPGCYKSDAACSANQTNCSPTKWICPGQGSQGSSSSNSSSSGYSNNAARTEAIANGVSTLIDIFSKSPEEEARIAQLREEYARRDEEYARQQEENQIEYARLQAEKQAWEQQRARVKQEQERNSADAENLFTSLGRNNSGRSTQASSGASTGGNPWASGKDERPVGDLTRPQCLEIQRPPKTGGYIGDLKVYNKCDEPISYSYCYRGGGRSAWKSFECKANPQGHFERGSSDIAPGNTAVLPESLSSTTVDLAVCKKGALPFITNINGRQSSFICQ